MLRMRMCPLDLLLHLPLLSSSVGRLLALLFLQGHGPPLSFWGCVDPSYVDAVIFSSKRQRPSRPSHSAKRVRLPQRVSLICIW